MSRIFLLAGALNGLLAVALGAFGAHGLRGRLTPDLYTVFQTGIQYHGLHALALLAVGLLALHRPSASPALDWCGWLFVVGILLFCGSLYLLALSAPSVIGMVTPVGGLALLAGWIVLAIAAWRTPPSPGG